MAKTYTPIATNKLTAPTATVTFSSIPSIYTDLVIVVNANADSSTQLRLRFNSDTGSNYSATMVGADGADAFTVRVSNEASMNAAGLATRSGVNILNIMNYANTTTYKTVIGRWNLDSPGYGETGVKIGTWRSTAAITSIVLFPTSGNFTTDSTLTLYGILKA